MYCKHCGAQIADDARFCHLCGQAQNMTSSAKLEQDSLDEQERAWGDTPLTVEEVVVDPETEARKKKLADGALKWGIVSLVLAPTFFLSLLGFIFSFFARKKARQYEREFGNLAEGARLGRVLGIIGFIVGLVMSIFFIFWLFLIFIIIVAEIVATTMPF